MECPVGTVFNPLSGNCVTTNGQIGRLILATQDYYQNNNPICPIGFVFDPEQKFCVSETSFRGNIIRSVLNNSGPVCPEGTTFNPITGRCVKISGKIGRTLTGRYNCSKYGRRSSSYQFQPLSHQTEITQYYIKLSEPGMLLYWGLGTGKTCASIMIIDEYINRYGNREIYILSTGSLRENYLYQYCMICGQDRDRLSLFNFISYNYSEIRGRLPTKEQMEGSIIVIDESHNLISGYMNGGVNYIAIFELLVSLKNVKFILLSGTPIRTNYLDLYYILKLIKPSAFPFIEDYNKHFIIKNGIYVPDETIATRSMNVISTLTQEITSGYYPKVYVEYTNIIMSSYQYFQYVNTKEIESDAYNPDDNLQYVNPQSYRINKTNWFLAVTMLRSRQRCNMAYPENILGIEDPPPDKLAPEGWINDSFINNLLSYAPKFASIIYLIENIKGKHVIYSQFKNRYGIFAIQSILNYLGYNTLTFTGDLNDDQRNIVLELFNDPKNINGDKYKVLLITDAGSEGQSFLQVRALHITEQYINEFDVRQIMGRVARYGSHMDLPENERDVIIYRYFAITPGEMVPFTKTPSNRQSSDYQSFRKAITKVNSVSALIGLLNSFPMIPDKNFKIPMPPVNFMFKDIPNEILNEVLNTNITIVQQDISEISPVDLIQSDSI